MIIGVTVFNQGEKMVVQDSSTNIHVPLKFDGLGRSREKKGRRPNREIESCCGVQLIVKEYSTQPAGDESLMNSMKARRIMQMVL